MNENDKMLERHVRKSDGDVREAVRLLTGNSIAGLARDMHVPRSTLSMCLGGTYGRRYEGMRRRTEAHLGLTPRTLDRYLP